MEVHVKVIPVLPLGPHRLLLLQTEVSRRLGHLRRRCNRHLLRRRFQLGHLRRLRDRIVASRREVPLRLLLLA